jgi:hypothetical protein
MTNSITDNMMDNRPHNTAASDRLGRYA